MNDLIHISGDNTAAAATDINDIKTAAEPAPIRINHLRQMVMKLIIVEAEGQLTRDDLTDLRMEDLLALRRELLASTAPRPDSATGDDAQNAADDRPLRQPQDHSKTPPDI